MLLPIVALLLAADIVYSGKICCGDLGCFTDSAPFNLVPLPWCVDEIKPMYRLYTRETSNRFHLISHGNVGPGFESSRKTVFLIHGWAATAELDWIIDMKDEFLKKDDYNVIAVDWRGGSQTIDYWRSSSNTRVLGADIAKLIKHTLEPNGIAASEVYCVGHSLGAHTCGLAGHALNGTLGRITGLDPAGPLWQEHTGRTRLDKSSAMFVDIIHSDGDCFAYCLGIGKDIGHVDFYPNGNGKQPGCLTLLSNPKHLYRVALSPSSASVDPQGIGSLVACSHHRAIYYFTESINSACKFSAVSCPGGREDEEDGNCDNCWGEECQSLGIDANTRKGRGRFYLRTNAGQPYCQW